MTPALRVAGGVTLAGGGALEPSALEAALARAPMLVAADGGADAVARLGRTPAAVIGDMDSVADLAGWMARGDVTVLPIAEQDSTDLEKCLYSIEAPFFLGVGFTGRRMDHALVALHALLRWRARPLLLIGDEDVAFLCPPVWRARLAVGARVSFIPLAPVTGLACAGLRWPVTGLDFAMGARVGASNEAISADVAASFSGPGMVCVLGLRWLDAALESLGVATTTA